MPNTLTIGLVGPDTTVAARPRAMARAWTIAECIIFSLKESLTLKIVLLGSAGGLVAGTSGSCVDSDSGVDLKETLYPRDSSKSKS